MIEDEYKIGDWVMLREVCGHNRAIEIGDKKTLEDTITLSDHTRHATKKEIIDSLKEEIEKLKGRIELEKRRNAELDDQVRNLKKEEENVEVNGPYHDHEMPREVFHAGDWVIRKKDSENFGAFMVAEARGGILWEVKKDGRGLFVGAQYCRHARPDEVRELRPNWSRLQRLWARICRYETHNASQNRRCLRRMPQR